MFICGKSAIKKNDLLGKYKICKNIELQLLNEFHNFRNPIRNLVDVVTSIPDINIVAVHTPLVKGDDTNIEYIGNKEDYHLISKTIELAGELSNYYDKEIKVIIHTSFRFKLYERFPSLLNKIETMISVYLEKYKNIVICFENVIPCLPDRENDEIYFRNGILYDNIYLVKHLRKTLNTNRVGTVLDTCHMMTSVRTLNRIFDDGRNEKWFEKYTEDNFFKENKDVVKLIHLSDVISLGLNKKEHGIGFTEERRWKLEKLIDLYQKYDYDCDITIEITEIDYVKNENFKNNYEMLKEILKNKNINIFHLYHT